MVAGAVVRECIAGDRTEIAETLTAR